MTTTSPEPPVGLPVPEIPPAPKQSLLGEARAELQAVGRYRSLLRYLVSSSVRTDNANTVLGYVWWVLDPLLLMAVYLLLIEVLLKRGGPDFAVFLLTGIVAWELFAKGVMKSISTTIAKERSMQQVAFPKSVLPLSTIASTVVGFVFAFAVLLVVAIPFGIYPSPFVVVALPIVVVQIILTLGIAFFLSALNVFFRDTSRLTRYVLRLSFFLSPILYPVSFVPERFRDLYELNPFATLIPAYRDVVMEHQMPDFAALGIVAAASIVILVLGFLFFVRAQPWFAKLV